MNPIDEVDLKKLTVSEIVNYLLLLFFLVYFFRLISDTKLIHSSELNQQ
jgi:hypothetical protein